MLVVLRSLLFYMWYLPSGAVVIIFMAAAGALLPIKWRLRIAGLWKSSVIGWLRISCGVRCSVEGVNHIPEPPYVVVSNHQGEWEAFCFQSLFHPVTLVVKEELLRIPLLGYALGRLQPIAIKREHPQQAARRILKEGSDRLAAGISVVLFPEGTRMAPGTLGRYRRSALTLASRSRVPLLPVVHNSGDCWPARRFLKHQGLVRVVIGAPVDPGAPADSIDTIEQWARATLAQTREPSNRNATSDISTGSLFK